MNPEELYKIYAAWTGQLHFYVVRELGRHVDVEYFPDDYFFGIYSGRGQDVMMSFGTTVPSLTRPIGERRETVKVPRPEDNPSKEDLDMAFRRLCFAAARVLGVELGKAALPESSAPELAPSKKHEKDHRNRPRRRAGRVQRLEGPRPLRRSNPGSS